LLEVVAASLNDWTPHPLTAAVLVVLVSDPTDDTVVVAEEAVVDNVAVGNGLPAHVAVSVVMVGPVVTHVEAPAAAADHTRLPVAKVFTLSTRTALNITAPAMAGTSTAASPKSVSEPRRRSG
jgi:hypothetical protein